MAKKKLNAAQKANRTRAARKAFATKYPNSAVTAEVYLREQSKNWRNYPSCKGWRDYHNPTIAAVKANLNRLGTFRDMALACNW